MKQGHISLLIEMGLTQTEAKIYLTLLKKDKSSAGAIASDSKLYRKNVYDALILLSEKGLVTHIIEKGKKYWICSEPEKIKKILHDKILKFDHFLPEFNSDFNKKVENTYAEVYEGKEGVKNTIDLILNENEPVFLLGATGKIFEELKYSIKNIFHEAKSKNLQAYFLMNYHIKGTEMEKGFSEIKKKFKKFQYRFMPKELNSKTQIYIFGGYSIVFTWKEKPISILIKNKEIAKGFKRYFDFLWSLSS